MKKEDLLKKIRKIKEEKEELSLIETNKIYIQVLTLFLLFIKMFIVICFKGRLF